MPPTPPVITRFAPSPTGHLHIGGARTALFCWAFARRQKGHFVLRVEDTDQARSSESSARGILEDLAWLGIRWHEGPLLAGDPPVGGDPRAVGPFFQAQRLGLYNKYIDTLVGKGLAYPGFETSEELEAKRKAATAKKETYRYDRAALAIPQAERVARMRAGEPHVVRLLMPDEPIHVVDEVLGEVKYAAGEVDDFVLRKADGFPTYHFAVVVDDELMGVTHVLRGQEHLNNTPKHVALQKALGFRTPVYAHMPLIFNMEGAKMSKREKDKAVREVVKKAGIKGSKELSFEGGDGIGVSDLGFKEWIEDKQRQLPADVLARLARRLNVSLPEIEVEDFRKAGYLPEVLCNFLALLGWSPGGDREKFDMDFLAATFDLSRIGKTNARFDRVKLASFNKDGIAALPAPEFAARWRAWCGQYAPVFLGRLKDRQFDLLAGVLQARAKSFADAAEQAAFVVKPDDDIEYDPKSVEKVLRKGEPSGLAVLGDVLKVLAPVEPFEPGAIQAALDAFAAASGVGMGQVAQPLRVAITGTAVSPPIAETLAILGKDAVARRVMRCLERCAAAPAA